jgi:hypothetical protein
MNDLMHGIAILNRSIVDRDGNELIASGTKGIITAYLPDMNKFAVMFPESQWITFDESEEEFNNICIVKLFD